MKKIILNFSKTFIVGGIFYFIVRFIFDHLDELKGHPLHFNYLSLNGSIALSLIAVFNYSLIWQFITQKVGCALSFERGIIAWFYAEIGKYIPGKMFFLGGKLYFYKQAGKSLKSVTFSFYLETICTLLGASLIFLISLLFTEINSFKSYQYYIYPLIFIFFLAIHPKVIEYVLNAGSKILKKNQIKIQMRYRDILIITGFYTINFLILGFSFYLLINSVYKIPFHDVFLSTGSFALASVIGMMSFLTPSGLGVREGVLVLALKNILPDALAGIISLISRVWAFGTEFVLILIIYVYAKTRGIKFHH